MWERPGSEYPRGRFLEYTSDEIASRFRELKSRQIAALMKLPCLFAYEGTDQPMQVGWLKELKLRDGGRTLYIAPEMDPRIAPIPFARIEPLQAALDIRTWELSRTHWAIKDGDLFEVLIRAHVVPQYPPTPKFPKEDLPPAVDPQRRISSVDEFIQTVLGMDHRGREVFYRGHSDRNKYLLQPSIFRTDDRGDFLYRGMEDRIYRELLVSNSADFEGDVYTLDRLVRMQHYSLPTRLLDITSNPLIALYFACKSNTRQPDRVSERLRG
jgi:hypothetical protein